MDIAFQDLMVSEEDVSCMYFILFGRSPENAAVIEENFGRTRSECIKIFISSREFSDLAKKAMLTWRLPHGERLDDMELQRAAAWVSGLTGEGNLAGASWWSLLQIVLGFEFLESAVLDAELKKFLLFVINANNNSEHLRYVKLIESGDALRKNGHRMEARNTYKEAALLMPKNTVAHMQIANLEIYMGNVKAAIEAYKTALSIDPRLEEARDEIVRLSSINRKMDFTNWDRSLPNFVIRGELFGTTGYAKAARAMAQLLSETYIVLGISVHENPADRSQAFPGIVISEDDLIYIAARATVIVIHHLTPDGFIPYPNALNIAAFYWETRAQPRRLQWSERLAFADAVWAPTSFVAEFVRAAGYQGPISMVPWAHDMSETAELGKRKRVLPSFPVRLYRRFTVAQHGELTTWPAIRRATKTIFLALQSLAPRKGLPLLLAAWRDHVEATPDADDILVLKLNFRHALGIGQDPAAHIHAMLETMGVKDGTSLRLAWFDESLSDAGITELLQESDCYVTATLGEGFGGPIMEAIIAGTPVISPRHTGIMDLLPEDYPLVISTTERCLSLMNNLDVYPPSATWCIADPGSIGTNIERFSNMTKDERAGAVNMALHHAESFCGVDVVRNKIATAVNQMNELIDA